MKKNYILGLDIGISSVGWGLLELNEKGEPFRILDVGSRIFPPGEIEKTGDSRAKERREKRGTRRVIRRRAYRLDKVKELLYNEKLLSGNILSDVPSEINKELTSIYENTINNYYKKNYTNPYILKVDALDRKLTNEELCIILVHYAKKRGYKSNREEAKSNNNESGKVLSAIKENKKIIEENNYRSISEMYIKDSKFAKKIKNSTNDYKISVTNEMYLNEINKVLDMQIEYGTISNDFKERYLQIYNSRRHYSEGPGNYIIKDENNNKIIVQSPYGGNLIERMTGKCDFDNNPRAPKKAPSSEVFVALTKLLNLRYKSEENIDYISLTKEQIKEIIDKAKEQKSITYNTIAKIINIKNVKFQGLQLSKNNYMKVIEETKKKLNIDKISIKDLNDNDKEVYNQIYNKKLLDQKILELSGYHDLKTIISNAYPNIWNIIKNNYDILDELARLCTNYKLNEEIKCKIEENTLIPKELSDINLIENLPNFTDHLNLSSEIIRKLIPLMSEGNKYNEAMEIIGYNHSNIYKEIEKKDLLVPINVSNSITNQRVIRSLTQARKVINSVIKKYGMPKTINIETARELAKKKDERKKIEREQLEKRQNNEKIKEHLVELGFFSSVDKISGNDLLKYKLWEEQEGKCAYSRKSIAIEDLFKNNIVQIDHILPYSRTFCDNYLNKTLVLTKENQEKGNKTPYEWLGNTERFEEFKNYINSLNIPSKKKDNYLLKDLDFDTEREMRDQNLNDTKYISKELYSLIKAYLNVENVNVFQGAMTAKLRARWNLNRLTHSYISNNYIMPKELKSDKQKDRDNHLHHAMDALIIASMTKSLQYKIMLYEKFSRTIDGLTKTQLSNASYTKEDDNLTICNEKNGEIIKNISLIDYLKEVSEKDYIYYNKNNVAKLKFPMPYDNFAEEAKIRVYEQNIDILKGKLKTLNTYTKKNIDTVKTLTPSIAKPKTSGALHEETYYGIKEIIKDESKVQYKTIRKDILKITKKDLENDIYRKSGSKAIYDAVYNWLGDYENGEKAFKARGNKYPVSATDKEQKEIKKLKIYYEYKNTGHMINKSNVEKGSIYRINIYKKEDSDILYFMAIDLFDLAKIKKAKDNSNFYVKLEYGQGKKFKILQYDEVSKNYELNMVLSKGDFVKIINKDGEYAIGYIVGLSSGMLEIKSAVGDGLDLIGENKIFKNIRAQYQITISTIKKIQKLSINTLGEISGL